MNPPTRADHMVNATADARRPEQIPLGDRLRIRWRSWSYGRAANNRALSEGVGAGLLLLGSLPGVPVRRRLTSLLTAARRLTTPAMRGLLRHRVQPWLHGARASTWRDQKIGWERYYGAFGRLNEERGLVTSLILKEPGPGGEKGVLYCSFEYNWMRILARHDAKRLLDEYYLVGASSWSPPDYAAFAAFAGISDDPLFIGISNVSDMETYRLMEPVVRAVPTLASDWVDPGMFTPKPASERDIDIVMVAHWSRFKRHWLLFDALRQLPSDLRVVLIGRDAEGRTEETLRREAIAFGARQKLEFRVNIPIDQVADHLSRARVSVLLSQREGSCVSVAESLFADTPVVMMADAHVGSKSYINESTGRLATRGTLAREIRALLRRPGGVEPRQWAEQHISAAHTSHRLNTILREHAVATGRPWTRDIAPVCWRYVPAYLDGADEARLGEAVDSLASVHGLTLEPFVHR